MTKLKSHNWFNHHQNLIFFQYLSKITFHLLFETTHSLSKLDDTIIILKVSICPPLSSLVVDVTHGSDLGAFLPLAAAAGSSPCPRTLPPSCLAVAASQLRWRLHGQHQYQVGGAPGLYRHRQKPAKRHLDYQTIPLLMAIKLLIMIL